MTDQLCLDSLDDAALDHLPFGVVRLGPTGKVERYNLVEAERARIQRWRAIGRDFFGDIVGTSGLSLAAAVAALPPGGRARVFHTFRSFHRSDAAVIDVTRTATGGAYLCIHRAQAV